MDPRYEKWSCLKIKINSKKDIYCNPGEIWWCSMGVNIGVEIHGKNDLFERPVLIIKVYNLSSILIVPITSKNKFGQYYEEIEGIRGRVILSQPRTLSSKRLARKIQKISLADLERIKRRLKDSLE
jgi:mRNA-degrading endonuclease toxin of MazEF toxin-antitoxin module